jgi:hypothetical protein
LDKYDLTADEKVEIDSIELKTGYDREVILNVLQEYYNLGAVDRGKLEEVTDMLSEIDGYMSDAEFAIDDAKTRIQIMERAFRRED